MFEIIINNYLHELKSGKKMTEPEITGILTQTVSCLANRDKTEAVFEVSASYVVYPYNQTAALLAKGQLPDDQEGFFAMRLDLAIAAALESLGHDQNTSDKGNIIFPGRLAAAVSILTRIAPLAEERTRSSLCDELATSLSLWLDSFVEEEQIAQEHRLTAAGTEES